ncbi:hypothetical protein ACWC10_05125 [Streptomyces sp. NPDC001595]|uniref:hypothetical protein n=1 Tax=Streptomyces sp. NPDC001532 TaxID=3154520 RepID=UPI003328AFBF
MTVERDGHGGDDRNDPLMAVITGEPLPDEARADAALLAEHRSAEADVALLREQLGIIGAALTEPAPGTTAPRTDSPHSARSPEHVPARRPRRHRPLRVARTGLAVAAAVAVFVGMGWLVSRSGLGDADAAGGSSADSAVESSQKSAGPLGSAAYLSCTRLLAEGKVTKVVPVPGTGQERVTLDVTRSWIPAGEDAADKATFVKGEDAVFGAPRHLRAGDQVLVAVPRRGAAADFWFVGEEDIAPQRRAIDRALPQARSSACG